MSWLSNLIVKISGDNKGLKSSLNESKGALSSFGTTLKTLGKSIVAGFSIAAIVAFGKKVIESSEALSDKFTFAVEGAKGSLREFFNMIARADFSNFFANLTEGYDKAKKLAEAMDLFSDKKAYLEYEVSGKKATAAQYEEIVKDTTGKYTLEKRKEYAEKLKQIELDIQKVSLQIAQETFDLQAQGWENTNKMAVDKAKELYKSIGNWSEETVQKMSDTFAEARKQLGRKSGYTQIEYVANRTGFTKASVELYKEYLDLLKKGEEDLIPKLFKTYQAFEESTTAAQERFNGVLRITNSLLKEEEKIIRDAGITAAPTGNLAIPSFAQSPGGELAGPPKYTPESIGANEWQNIWSSAITGVTDQMTDAFETVFKAIGSGDWEGVGKDILGSFGSFISNLGKMLVAYGVMKSAFFKSLTMGEAGASVAIGAGLAAIAIGALFQGAASRGTGAMSGGSGGGGYAGSGSNAEFQTVKVQVEGVIKGKDIYITNRRYIEDNG